MSNWFVRASWAATEPTAPAVSGATYWLWGTTVACTESSA